MVDKNKTLIAALLDRSGSMSTSKAATEEGFNALIRDQAKQDGQALVTLAQFDTGSGWRVPQWQPNILGVIGEPGRNSYKPEYVYKIRDITSVPELTISPRGGTPLIDAIGEFVTDIGRDLAKMREQDRPGTVICLVMTDGEENSSQGWKAEEVRALIRQQEDVYKWKFMFLGANIDAVETGAHLGFARGSSITYNDDSPVAVAAAYGASSNLVSNMRSNVMTGASLPESYTDEDREEANAN